ncbi:MAG: hypothetical protein WC343_10115 [Bacilli bacterium]|jgi:hypothetical protein
MNIKGVIITCVAVVLYLSLCTWRFERLANNQGETTDDLVINVKY